MNNTVAERNRRHADAVATSKTKRAGMKLKPGAILALRLITWILDYRRVCLEFHRQEDCNALRRKLCRVSIHAAAKTILYYRRTDQ